MGNGRHGIARCALAAVLVCAAGAALTGTADARRHYGRMLTDPELDAALVVDAGTGGILYARNAAAPRRPASLTKMMTLYLLFEELRARRIALDTTLAVSAKAAAQPRSHLRLREGSTIPVDMAIKGIVICSANDAAVAVAEAVGGSEGHFSEMMTAKARRLGMARTFFHNATGLPDEMQQTTAEDLAILARHLIHDFPEYYGYFAVLEMRWRGNDCTTHNALLGAYAGADGIKTGYIDASGYNLVGTAQRGGRRLIAGVMGGLTAERRDAAAMALLDAGFETPTPIAMLRSPPPRPAARPTARPAPVAAKPGLASAVAAILLDPTSPLVWALALFAHLRR